MDMEEYKISVTRTTYKTKMYAVDADSVDEAIGQAEQLAYDDDFSCADGSEYDFTVIGDGDVKDGGRKDLDSSVEAVLRDAKNALAEFMEGAEEDGNIGMATYLELVKSDIDIYVSALSDS